MTSKLPYLRHCRLATHNESLGGRHATMVPGPRRGLRASSAGTTLERHYFAVVEDAALVGAEGENLAAPDLEREGTAAGGDGDGVASGDSAGVGLDGVRPPRRSTWRRNTVLRTLSNLARRCPCLCPPPPPPAPRINTLCSCSSAQFPSCCPSHCPVSVLAICCSLAWKAQVQSGNGRSLQRIKSRKAARSLWRVCCDGTESELGRWLNDSRFLQCSH